MDTGRISCEDRRRDWGGASTCQETLKIGDKLPEKKPEKGEQQILPTALGENQLW